MTYVLKLVLVVLQNITLDRVAFVSYLFSQQNTLISKSSNRVNLFSLNIYGPLVQGYIIEKVASSLDIFNEKGSLLQLRLFWGKFCKCPYFLLDKKNNNNSKTVHSCKCLPLQMFQRTKLLAYQLSEKKLDLLC